jgi:hypothetical protein
MCVTRMVLVAVARPASGVIMVATPTSNGALR